MKLTDLKQYSRWELLKLYWKSNQLLVRIEHILSMNILAVPSAVDNVSVTALLNPPAGAMS